MAETEEKKSYQEMSREELESALLSAEANAKTEKKFLDKTGFFTNEYNQRKAEYNQALGEVNAIKSEIFSRNQKEAISRLNDETKAAMDEYYSFQTEGPGTAKTVMSFLGLYLAI